MEEPGNPYEIMVARKNEAGRTHHCPPCKAPQKGTPVKLDPITMSKDIDVLSARVGAGNSAVVVDLSLCGPMLSPRVPNLAPIPGPRMERVTPGQRPRLNYGHPQASPVPV